jgi:hypothetical protein
VSATDSPGPPLGEFAQAHGLALGDAPELPRKGGLLREDDLRVGAAATGALPGGEPGTICHLTYTYHSDDTTHTVERTAAVLRVPQSLGFAPYLGTAASIGIGGVSLRSVKLAGGGSLRVADGINDAWLAELLSPAFSDWLARSPEGFEWELAEGVLCASVPGHVAGEAELTRLCADAAHIADVVREECLEEVDSGQAPRSAARPKRKADERLIAAILDHTTFEHPPADVQEDRPQFRRLVVRHPSTYLISLFMTLAIQLGVNIIGGGIYGLLLNLPNPGQAVLIYQASLFVIIGFFVLRSQINGTSQKLAVEGFWREYARTRGLHLEDPSSFAAAHAKADLPGAPTRVMTGMLGGIDGSLMLTGDGLRRGDSIALVAGPTGPVASADLEFSAPGASAKALDAYVERLAGELRAARTTASR